MSETIHLALPYIAAAQAQKHVTHNEALRILDALVMLAVKDRDLSAPPGSPADGDRYLVNPAGSGAFAGKDNQIAHYRDSAWDFRAPQAGWICFVEDEDIAILFDGTDWLPLLGANPELQNVALLGLGTTADAANPLSAKLNNAVWTARYDSEGGDGNLRTTLNKESAGDIVSLLLQTGFSGRAEIGLIGDDDLAFKVSADGSAWIEALKIARSTGKQTIASDLIVGGLLGIGVGNTTPLAQMNVANDSALSNRGIAVGLHSNNSSGALAAFYKSRGNFASPSQISAGDSIGLFFARPYVNGDYRNMAGFGFVQNGTIAGSDAPTDIVFSPGDAVISSITAGEKFRFANSGDFRMGGSGGTTVITAARHQQLRSYTVGTLPSAATAGQLIHVSNETGGAVPAFSDGTNWRRVTDRAIVA
jgi:hypothetical protein